MEGFTATYVAGLAASLTVQVFDAMGKRLKQAVIGTEREQALQRCLKTATFAFLTSASSNTTEDEVKLLSGIFTKFFEEPEVGSEVVSLLKGRAPDREELLYLFEEAGYEKETLPMLDFGKALSAFELAFLMKATQEETLQGEIQAKVALEKLKVQEDTRDAIQEMLQVIEASREQTIQILDGILTAVSRQENRRLEFRFPQSGEFVVRDWESHYLRTLIEHFDKIDLSQIHSSTTDEDLEAPVRVTEVFTSLYLDRLYSPIDYLDELHKKVKGRNRRISEPSESKTSEPVLPDTLNRELPTAVEAIAVVSRLVILGRPGGGKSTLAHHITSTLARMRLGQNVNRGALPGWNKEDELLPVMIVLRRFAAWIPSEIKKGNAGLVWDYLEFQLKSMGCKEAAAQVKHYLTEHGGMIVFDGLDEVRETDAEKKRTILKEAIEQFAAPLHKCKVVVTCREYAYNRGDDWRLPEHTFPAVELGLFKSEQIEYFINTWYRVVGPKKRWDEAKCLDEARKLNQAVESLPHLQELAQYPLLLTLMAQVHGKDGYLPGDRADLYEKAVNLLLQRWENRIVVEMEGGRKVEKAALIMQLGVRTEVLRNALEQVAFTAHERQEKQPDREERAADIPREELRDELEESLGSVDKADLVIEYIQDRAGLLQARDNKTYAFPHRTFQEYLTATYIMRQSELDTMLRDRVRRDLNWWREVFLLACGTQKKTPRYISDIIDVLVPVSLADAMLNDRIEQLQLAAQALIETEFRKVAEEERREEPGRYYDTYHRIQTWLADSVPAVQKLKPTTRARCGALLSQLGDPRKELTTLDHMQFCLVPAGPFMMGSNKHDREKPQEIREFLDYDYWMATYPITNAQFDLFVKAGGYENPDYWVEAREQKVWQNGKVIGRFDKEPRDKPEDFEHPYRLANHPVVGITWYEALAFTRWLTDIYRQKNWFSDKWQITLPSEAEWEKAARGGQKISDSPIVSSIQQVGKSETYQLEPNANAERDHPWGPEADANLANYDETGIGSTSTPGCFPGGASPYGCQEMSGNASEWTRSLLRDYPYDPDDGREVLTADRETARVLRGGAFNGDADHLRCSYRGRDNPDDGNRSVGFRVVLAPLL